MDKEQIKNYLRSKPYTKSMGAGLLSRRLNTTPDVIKEAKREVFSSFTEQRLKTQIKLPKVLIFDIETAPMKAYVWGRWKQNISLSETISEWFMICWSAKWLYSAEVMSDCVTPSEALKEDDKRIAHSLWELINEADIVVTHNGDRFDIPKINSRFIIHGLVPPKPYFSVDTCKVAKRNFGFSSNKLDALAGYFGFEHKLGTDFDLWIGCLRGDEHDLDYMVRYNKVDVIILEDVYLKLLPWMKGNQHPNMGNFYDSNIERCAKCGSTDVEEIEGEYYYTTVNKYKIYRCEHCGSISRARKCEHKDKTRNTNIGH